MLVFRIALGATVGILTAAACMSLTHDDPTTATAQALIAGVVCAMTYLIELEDRRG